MTLEVRSNKNNQGMGNSSSDKASQGLTRGTTKDGLRFSRRFTATGENPLEKVSYELRDSIIQNPDGSVVFELRGAEVPKDWSQLASDIAISKYFRKAGLHGDPKRGERSADPDAD